MTPHIGLSRQLQKQFRIAVLIPAYNAEPYICEALDSVGRETRRPDEVIVVDDGSTDQTLEAVREWMAGSDLDVRLIQQEHRGASAARNTALRHARSELVNFMDADDLALPNRLKTLEGAFHRTPDLICCFADAEVFDANGLITQSCIKGKGIDSLSYDEQKDGLRIATGSIYLSLADSYYLHVDSTLLLKRAALSIAGFDERFTNAEDMDFFLRLSRRVKFGYYPFALSRIRQHETNLTHRRNALRMHRNTVAVLSKMIGEARNLNLSPEELQATVKTGAEHAQNVLYLTSRRGLMSYRRARRRLRETGFVRPRLQPRHFLRAVYYSIRKLILGHDRAAEPGSVALGSREP